MEHEEKGVIDEKLSSLMLNFFDSMNKQQLIDNNAHPFDTLSSKEIQLFEAIADKKYTMGELSNNTGIKESTLTHISDKLVKKGFLTRERTEKDRRVVLVYLSKKGQEEYQTHRKAKKDKIDSILSTLEFEEQVTLLNVFEKINRIYK